MSFFLRPNSYLLCDAMLIVTDEQCHAVIPPFCHGLKPGSAVSGVRIPPLRVLRPESLANSGALLVYRSTIRPASFGVLRLLPTLGYDPAIVTIFRPVGAGEKRFAANRAPLHGVLAEYLHFKSLSFYVSQQHPAEDLAADGIRECLRARDFLAIVQVKAIAIVTGTAQLPNERDGPLPLPAVHARERPVRLSLNRREQFKME